MVTGPVSRLLLTAMIMCCICVPASVQAEGNTITYSIVHISDTQNLATYYPETYNLTFSYLESQKSRYNISAIIITGDIVNTWDKKKEWDTYLHARNLTTIPVYVIAGNHDTDSGKNYQSYTRYTGEPENGYVTSVGDFDLVGIDYTDKTLSREEFSRIRATLANSSRSNAIIATHWYMNKDKTLSPLGKDIDINLIVKPSLVLMGHKHEDFVQQKNISDFPVVEDMTNYQDGVPGGNGDRNYSAGTLYTVTSAGGKVEKITSRVIHISSPQSVEKEKTVFELPQAAINQVRPALPGPEISSPLPVPVECNAADVFCRLHNLVEQGLNVLGSILDD